MISVVDRTLGPDPTDRTVVLVSGVAPTTPETLDGQPTMDDADLRYWSLRQNESSVSEFEERGCAQ